MKGVHVQREFVFGDWLALNGAQGERWDINEGDVLDFSRIALEVSSDGDKFLAVMVRDAGACRRVLLAVEVANDGAGGDELEEMVERVGIGRFYGNVAYDLNEDIDSALSMADGVTF